MNISPAPRSQTPVRAAIYCRVSSAAQEDNSSLGTQESRCRTYAANAGYVVTHMFREVHTAAELFERSELGHLRGLVRQHQVDVVIVYALDRLSRNQTHLGFLFSELDHLGVRLEIVSESIDDTPEGRLLQSVRAFVAEMERLKFKERSQRGVRARVDSGSPIPGPRPPYGYRWHDEDKTKYDLDPDTAPIARSIFDKVLEGRSLRSIAMELTAQAVPTPSGRGKRWEVSTLHCVLKHPIYTGRVVAYRSKVVRERGKSRAVFLPEDEWVSLPADLAPRLVSDAEFEAVKARLDHNRKVAPRHNANPEATLLRCGIGRCGYCGHALSITRRAGGKHLYRCHPLSTDRKGCPSFGILAPILDLAVWSQVEQVLTDPSVIHRELERRTSIDPMEEDRKALERRAKDVEARRNRVARAIALLDDEEASAPLVLELRQLSADARNIQNEVSKLTTRAARGQTERQKLADLAAWCSHVAGQLPSLGYADKRMVLDALGVSVKVFRADHEPRWEITMAPLPLEPVDDERIVFSKGTPSSTAMRPPTPNRSTG